MFRLFWSTTDIVVLAMDADNSSAAARFEFDDDVDTQHFLDGHDDGFGGKYDKAAVIMEFKRTIGTWW